MQQKGTTTAYAATILYSLIIGFSFMFVKMIIDIAEPFDILAYRFLIAFVVLTIPILVRWVKVDFSFQNIKRFLPLVMLYPFLFIFQTAGLLGATSSEGGIIQATAPIFTVILASIFLKEKTNIWQKLFLMLSVGGVASIFIMQGLSISGDHVGSIIFLLLSTLSLAVYSILLRRLNTSYTIFELTYFIIAFCFICFAIIAVVQHMVAGTISEIGKPLFHPVFLSSILYLGICSTVMAMFLSNFAFSKLEAYKVVVFNNLSTVISILAGSSLLGESITYGHLIGAVLIIIGVVGTNLGDKWRRKKNNTPSSDRVHQS